MTRSNDPDIRKLEDALYDAVGRVKGQRVARMAKRTLRLYQAFMADEPTVPWLKAVYEFARQNDLRQFTPIEVKTRIDAMASGY